MNDFEKKMNEVGCYPLRAERISVLCVMLTFKCNLRCTHCYVDASPDRTEVMSLDTIKKVLNVLKKHDQITTMELTGGEPILNPHFRYVLKSSVDLGKITTIASNLTLFNEPGMEDLPEFLAQNRAKIFTSLPYYREDIVDKQRGKGTYNKVISSLKKLNDLGYGHDGSGLELDLQFNPPQMEFVPDRIILEKIYREKLMEMHGITFNGLIVLNNCPLGRTRKLMDEETFNNYMKDLERKFSPDMATSDNMMCKYMIVVSPEGDIYDCVFYQELNRPLKNGRAIIDNFDYINMSKREMASNHLCFYCTTNEGVTCFQFAGEN